MTSHVESTPDAEAIGVASAEPPDTATPPPSPPMQRIVLAGQHAFFYALLVVAIWQSVRDGQRVAPAIIVGLVLGAWYSVGAWRLNRVEHQHSTIAVVWLAGLTAAWVVAMAVSADFTWVVFILLLLYLTVLRSPWSWLTLGLVTIGVVGYRLLTQADDGNPGGVIGPVVGALAVVGFWKSYQTLDDEARRRQQLVHELLATQNDLLATHDALAAAQREAGKQSERTRLAREIHDTLAQGFSSILLLARAAQANPANAVGVVGQIEAVASDNLAEARRVVHALAPPDLTTSSLTGTLRRISDRQTEQTGVAIEVRQEGQPYALDVAREVALLRVAQSALANVRSHAQAQRATLTLHYSPGAVVLDVIDDGIGFESTQPASYGFGLRSMRQRIAELGGTFAVESQPGEGTAVSARLPLTGTIEPSTQPEREPGADAAEEGP